ncbi:MAG: UDP-N-acetylmuramate--alanine ligase [Candidatus Tokpelaia sp. JSC085]|nr:MAG: UDP-N-acetylmuramate--alanine ligase [Candidatus Tokpelaia sp. JSC085]
MKMPLDVGFIHFIGIGGIGMSGIAKVLHHLGYKVQGSDQANNTNVVRLREMGIQVLIGHAAENLCKAQVVVISAAIKKNNPEYISAREKRLPIIRRAEMLAELMRFRQAIAVGGTHGKTTTTSLVATLLEAGGFDPTVINGGIINAYGTNAHMGEGDWMVVEADESDGTFLNLPAAVAIVTNIDPEHLDYYGSFERMRRAFCQFVGHVPFYGFGVVCLDHPEVQFLLDNISDRRLITYGANPQAEVRFINHRMQGLHSHFDVIIRNRQAGTISSIKNIVLPMPGRHNVANATAAIAVAHELGVTNEAIIRGLASFSGVRRRFTHTGSWNGVEIFDDYGHHPVEIIAVLKAARSFASGRVVAVMQPHRYSRLHDLFDAFSTCFNDADIVMIAPVYAAGEEPIEGVNAEMLVKQIKTAGHRNVHYISGSEALAPLIAQATKSGDCVVFLGAGNITQWAYALPRELEMSYRTEQAIKDEYFPDY